MPNPSQDALLLVLLKKHLSESVNEVSVWDDLGGLYGFSDLVEKHPRLLRSMHFQDPDYPQAIKEVLEQAERRTPGTVAQVAEYVQFAGHLRQHDEGNYHKLYGLAGAALNRVNTAGISTAIDVNREVLRIQRSLHDDPELALGSAKELIESVLKKILADHGETPGAEDIPQLMKKVQQKLDLDPSLIAPSAPGALAMKRMLSGLSTIVQGLTELRNLYGTGHGKAAATGLQDHQVQLAVTAAGAAAAFLLETHQKWQQDLSRLI